MVIRIFLFHFYTIVECFRPPKKNQLTITLEDMRYTEIFLDIFEELLWCNALLYTGQKETSSIFLHEHIIIICQCHITGKTDKESVCIQMLAVSGTSQQVVTCKLCGLKMHNQWELLSP